MSETTRPRRFKRLVALGVTAAAATTGGVALLVGGALNASAQETKEFHRTTIAGQRECEAALPQHVGFEVKDDDGASYFLLESWCDPVPESEGFFYITAKGGRLA